MMPQFIKNENTVTKRQSSYINKINQLYCKRDTYVLLFKQVDIKDGVYSLVLFVHGTM